MALKREDWSNETEKSALITSINYIHIKKQIFENSNNISQYSSNLYQIIGEYKRLLSIYILDLKRLTGSVYTTAQFDLETVCKMSLKWDQSYFKK